MESKLLKLGALIGFIIVMLISTWATVESLHRLLDWPRLVIWPLSIIFFCFAAIGVNLIVKAFDYSALINGRGKYLIGGTILILLFWVLLILPTNTHTFFYKRTIKLVASNDILNSRSDLISIPSKGLNYLKAQRDSVRIRAMAAAHNLEAELTDPNNLGRGLRADTLWRTLDDILGQKIQKPALPSERSQGAMQRYADEVDRRVAEMIPIVQRAFDTKIRAYAQQVDPAQTDDLANKLGVAEIEMETLDEPNEKIKTLLTKSHAKIDNLIASFPSKEKPALSYVSAIEYENVYQVWKMFFAGKFKDQGFGYFILGAVLIDVVGFILFTVAFKNEN